MKVDKFLDRYFYKEDIQGLLEMAELSVSGTKDELIKRLRLEGNYDIFQLIGYLGKDDLKEICDDLNLPISGTKDELQFRVFTEIVDDWSEIEFVSEMKKARENNSLSEKEFRDFLGPLYDKYIERERVIRKPGKEKVREAPIITPAGIPKPPKDFSELVSAIERWIPLKRHRNEEGYQLDLRTYLQYKCGYHVRLEAGETLADILVDNRFPIEVKKNPTQPQYDMLLGQLTRDYRAKGSAIAVVCDVRRLEKFQDFKYNALKSFERNIAIISK